ncbi:MAG: folate-binding protein YgfZ [Betaproteobacteria bacterium]|uniref:Folate-binding protein YgfZ n=1 Tax=Candidatus Proximibacter danicus TaxID=2954365 RepID=A0A9D7JXN5_9PROT|nr:folate-binding protein YgfZ [Candidatus Proximibacter danicus]MBK9447567.1 folate-binding protein YgfZ [Betaproteobacteria bacterium]
MNPLWKDALDAAGARFDTTNVLDFGDAAGELIAARDGTVLAPLTHLGGIRVAGEEAKSFLHSQLTSDINHLSGGAVQHAAWCSAKGRMLASFIVRRDGNDYILQLSADLVPAIAKRLQMFVLRAKVTIADISDNVALLGIAGPKAADALRNAGLSVPEIMQSVDFADGQIVRLDESRFHIAVGAAAAGKLWQTLAATARPVGISAWRWLDIRAALPLISEATREQFVPQMANFERIGGVSFHKGCYPGQEIVARTQYLGKVKRHLYRLGAAEAMAAGDELFSVAAPDQACGMVISATASPAGGYEALAVLMESAADAGVQLRGRDGLTVSAAPVAA